MYGLKRWGTLPKSIDYNENFHLYICLNVALHVYQQEAWKLWPLHISSEQHGRGQLAKETIDGSCSNIVKITGSSGIQQISGADQDWRSQAPILSMLKFQEVLKQTSRAEGLNEVMERQQASFRLMNTIWSSEQEWQRVLVLHAWKFEKRALEACRRGNFWQFVGLNWRLLGSKLANFGH